MNFKSILKLALLTSPSICFCHLIYAQENIEAFNTINNELSLEELYQLPLVAIATGTAVPQEKAPSITSLISAKDI